DVYGELSFALGHEVDDGFRARLTFANGFKAMVDVSTTSFLPEAKFWMQSASGSVVIEDREMNGRIVRRTGAEEEDATPVQAGVGLTKTMAPRIL
ncbi:putative dehydrogenase, partial [human gut metagenome]